MRRIDLCALGALAAMAASSSARSQEPEPPATLVWDEAAARHLYDRAGFGARRDELQRAVSMGQEACVDALFELSEYEPFPAVRYELDVNSPSMGQRRGAEPSEERREAVRDLRRDDLRQLSEFRAWWVRRMIDSEDPLRERMTLFWHGHFTSGFREVRSSQEMIAQNELFRAGGLGSFALLLHDIARDAAMLEYLDNDVNRVGEPNENFARELLELFTLGEGNYTEQDVREVARAFTGWSDRRGEFRFGPLRHDNGRKTVLGESGRLGGNDVLDLLLEQDACPRWIAGNVIEYFEGIWPAEARLEQYAQLLLDADYELEPLLRALFLDPDFYRAEVVGMRVASPIDYLVGIARRLGLDPPPGLIAGAGRILGENLLEPPNVEGWEGGLAWITTSSLMSRANLAGVLLGVVDLEDLAIDPELLEEEPGDGGMGMGMEDPELAETEQATGPGARMREALQPLGRQYRGMGALMRGGWEPNVSLTLRLRRRGARSEAECVDELLHDLLSVAPTPSTRAELIEHVERGRTARELEPGRLLFGGRRSEELLRETAHLILSLPEAQLH